MLFYGIELYNICLRIQSKRSKWRRETKLRRREEWLATNGPCRMCGRTDNLQIDHIDPSTKTKEIADIWLLGLTVRQTELAKCQALCVDCHVIKIEFFSLTCFKCGSVFTKKARAERFARKTRKEGPFCSAVCKASVCGQRRWDQQKQSPEALTKTLRIIELGKQGTPIKRIQQILGGRHEIIKRVLQEANIPTRKQGGYDANFDVNSVV